MAAAASLYCSLTDELMRDPVLCDDGVTYEREAISSWLQSNNTSPATGVVLPSKRMVDNLPLRARIEQLEENLAQGLSLSALELEEPPLGAGAFKTVFRGKLLLSEGVKRCPVAVLKMRNGSCETEAQVFLNLGRHPRVVRFFGRCTDEEHELLVTEFAKHGSLSDAFEALGEQMTLQHDVVIMHQISQGMGHLISQGMFHRDLAARNVLLFRFEPGSASATSVKVADFGLSICSDNRSHAYKEGRELPVRYLPPEALQRGRFSEKSDVWAFGVTCWELLTRGMVPYYDKISDSEVIRFVCGGGRLPREELVSACPDAVWEQVLACWQPLPAQRASFAALAAALAGLGAEEVPAPEDQGGGGRWAAEGNPGAGGEGDVGGGDAGPGSSDGGGEGSGEGATTWRERWQRAKAATAEYLRGGGTEGGAEGGASASAGGGLRLEAHAQGLRVVHVEGGAAGGHSPQEGDVITHIGGEAARTVEQAEALLCGEDGSLAEVTVTRAGEALPLYLFLPRRSQPRSYLTRRNATIAAAAVAGAAALPAMATAGIAALGFTSSGIAGGSIAAGMMSAEAIAGGGGVAAGGLVATLQSVGVLGFSSAAMAGMATGGGAVAAGVAGLATKEGKEEGREGNATAGGERGDDGGGGGVPEQAAAEVRARRVHPEGGA